MQLYLCVSVAASEETNGSTVWCILTVQSVYRLTTTVSPEYGWVEGKGGGGGGVCWRNGEIKMEVG